MKKVIIISDFFKEDFEKQNIPCGGAELNDSVLFDHLEDQGLVHGKLHSNQASPKDMISFIEQNKEHVFLISNFSNMHFRGLGIFYSLPLTSSKAPPPDSRIFSLAVAFFFCCCCLL